MPNLLVCDLDGTLLLRGEPFDWLDVQTLRELGECGVVRAIATGRALATARKVIDAEFPIDYLIFSSGAGILEWRSQALLVSHEMRPEEVAQGIRVFVAHGLDFMVHAPIPDQHVFQFHRTGKSNPDFERRLARYAADGRVLERGAASSPASQLLAVSPSGDPAEPFETLRRELSALSVIRATSPLDGHSMWIEAFAPAVSKSQAAAWIAARHSIVRENTSAIGNDYNDWDLLRWAGRAAVVQDAPAAMRAEFAPVDSLHAWLEARKDALDFLSNRRCNT
jgi:hydroxymethylpyrimidine pyrophosphatase-like HAD family hydrolase